MRQAITGGKANGGTPKAVAAAKKAAAKKKPAAMNAAARKPIRQIETSMSAKYKGTTKVSQSTIDSIKKLGMTAALKKAGTSKNPEYLEGVKRMYGAKRVASVQGAATAKKKAAGLSGLQKRAISRGM